MTVDWEERGGRRERRRVKIGIGIGIGEEEKDEDVDEESKVNKERVTLRVYQLLLGCVALLEPSHQNIRGS